MKPKIRLEKNLQTGVMRWQCGGACPYGDGLRGFFYVHGYGDTPEAAYADWKCRVELWRSKTVVVKINSSKAIDK